MSGRDWVQALLFILALGCAAQRISPPRLAPGQTITVLPPNNRTDDPLIVAGNSVWDVFANQSRRVTVPDVLAAETRTQLEQRGFTVVLPTTVEAAIGDHTPSSLEEAAAFAIQGKTEGNVLYIEIVRWESDAPLHPSRVLVSFEATLIDGTTGHVVWTTHQPLRPVPTPGAATQWGAYMIAARQVAEQLLNSW